MQPSTAQSTRSAESLDAVLGLFQAWSDSRNTDSHNKDMTDGIRELSYEDALQSSRYRWQARAEAPGIVAPGKVDPVVWPAAGKPERQVSMSLRVAASEQALIKVRAAEAGLSASAYLRQCASSGAAAGAGSAHPCRYRGEVPCWPLSAGEAPVQTPVPRLARAPRFLERMRRRIFGGSTDQLTLQA